MTILENDCYQAQVHRNHADWYQLEGAAQTRGIYSENVLVVAERMGEVCLVPRAPRQQAAFRCQILRVGRDQRRAIGQWLQARAEDVRVKSPHGWTAE